MYLNQYTNMNQKFSRHSYGEITDTNSEGVFVKNEQGMEWFVEQNIFNNEFKVIGEPVETRKVSRTEMVEIIMSGANTIMEIGYNKKVDEKAVTTSIMESVKNSSLSELEAKVKAEVKKALKGEERVIMGRHHGSVDEFGRINFIDMNVVKDDTKDYDVRYRKVDPRTANYLIFNNVKYIAK